MKPRWTAVALSGFALMLLPPGLYYGTLFVVHGGNPDFLKIDACLDAGGRWDYEKCEAVFEEDGGLR